MGWRNQELKKLEVPYYPEQKKEDRGHGWVIYTVDEKAVCDYTRMTIKEVEDMDLVEYLCYLRDARIYNLSQTEDGQNYLKNAWRINQTEPERKRLREKFGNKEGSRE